MFGIIGGDFHGNGYAAEAFYKEIKAQNPDFVVLLGDYSTDFPWTNKVCGIMQKIFNECTAYVISGNREEYMRDIYLHPDKLSDTREKMKIWTYEYGVISPDNLKWLLSLPKSLEITIPGTEMFTIYHSWQQVPENVTGLFLSGHWHTTAEFCFNGQRHVISPSAGLAYAQREGSYTKMIWNGEKWEFSVHPLLYNYLEVAEELVQDKEIIDNPTGWGYGLLGNFLLGTPFHEYMIVEILKIARKEGLKDLCNAPMEWWDQVNDKIYLNDFIKLVQARGFDFVKKTAKYAKELSKFIYFKDISMLKR